VEIIRGAASSIYGANALAGVINVITKEPAIEKPLVNVNCTLGSFNDRTLGVNAAKNYGNFETNISASKLMTDGFRENSAYDNNNLNMYAGFNNTALGKLKIKGGMSQYDMGSPGRNSTPVSLWDNVKEKAAYDPNARQKNNNQYLTLSSDRKLTDNFGLDSSLYASMGSGRYTSPVSYIDDITNKQTIGLDMRCNASFGLTAGFELRNDAAKRTNEIAGIVSFDKQIDWTSLYLQEEFSPVKAVNTLFGLRYDKHSMFGGELSPQLTVVWKQSNDWKFSSNAGKSFRAPTFEDLFSPFSSWPAFGPFPGGDTQGNLDLKPETSLSYDVGAEKNGKITLLQRSRSTGRT
jgi:outer membrane cobalamin receptor